MSAWFDWYPERLESELEAFARQNIDFVIDEEARAHGQLVLDLRFEHDGKVYELKAVFPDLYPFFAPDVFAPQSEFVRHQHPISKHLCLLGRRTSQWHTNYLLADILPDQLRAIIEFNDTRNVEAIKEKEEPQGEPISEYFNGSAPPGSYFLFDSAWKIPEEIRRGSILFRHRMIPSKDVHAGVPQGIAVQVADADRNVLYEWDGPTPSVYDKAARIPWVRIDPPPTGSHEDLKQRISRDDRRYLRIDQGHSKKHPYSFFAILFSEEVEQFAHGDGWAVVEQSFDPRRNREPLVECSVRTFRAGTEDLAARMPSVRSLKGKSVGIFGLGALGSVIAMELARNGVGSLYLVDGDYIEPATVRRWAFGWTAFGMNKGDALASRIREDYPWTKPTALDLRVGATGRSKDNVSQFEKLTTIISDHDLIIDATAELGVNHVLAELCRLQNRPFLLANATPGAWGGMVAQFRADRRHSCWLCMRSSLYEPPSEDLPHADPRGELQPPGCAARTFTGTSFDLQEVALEAVRVAVGLVGAEDGYPQTPWQLSILNLRANDRTRILPQWSSKEIIKRPNCKCLDSP